jgi:hypothetical protein
MEILLVVLMLLVVAGLVPVATVFLVRAQLQRRIRVSPRVPTDAPIQWIWSPVFAARLHRRLQRAAALARAVVALHQRNGDQTRLVEMARTLEREALNLDERLVLVGRLHVSQRRRAFPPLLAEVARLEKVALRLSLQQIDHRVDARLADQSSAVHQLAVELDALDAANDELRRVEAEAGLDRPAPLHTMLAAGSGATSRRPSHRARPRHPGNGVNRPAAG